MTAAEARTVLEEFWESCGPTTVEQGTQALLAAYQLGDKEEFAGILGEVVYPGLEADRGDVAWEVLTAFKQSDIAPQ